VTVAKRKMTSNYCAMKLSQEVGNIASKSPVISSRFQ